MGLFQSKPPPPQVGVFTPAPAPTPTTSSRGGWGSTIMTVIGGIVLVYVAITFFNYIQKQNGQLGVTWFDESATSSGDKTPSPVDGKTRTVIPAGELPVGSGIDYGVQYWMYISNWDYRFGQDKNVLKRVAPNDGTILNPRIYLAPNENTLHVSVTLFPTTGQAASAEPGVSSTGDTFTCSVENVPLQSWFSVSVTVFQRNLDIYINGRLVKSCVLPGIPKPALGDIILNDNGGFAGSICNVNSYNEMLNPDDAKAFFAKGTNCQPPAEAPPVVAVDKDSVFITLFGYTFRFSTISKDGKELSSYTF